MRLTLHSTQTRIQTSTWCSLIIAVFLLVSLATTTKAGLPNYKLCFPDVINTPDTFLMPPDINGIITGDNGWTSSFRYVLDNGTASPDVVVQGIRDGSFIYLSFEVRDDDSFDDQDMIIIAFDPDGTAANQRRLHIFPLFSTGAQASGDPRDVQYWQNSSTWNTTGSGPAPDGTIIKATSATVGSEVAWFVEMRLPIAGLGLPAASDFGFYFNVMRVTTEAGAVADERHWPPFPDSPDILIDPTNTPPASQWGNGAFSGTCNGVSITSSDITTNQNPTSKIALNAANNFNVLVHNNSINSAGTAVAANDINATFKIANFGLPGAWNLVPAAGNPTAFTTDVPASSTATITVGPWNLTAAEQATYSDPDFNHQCILVELDSNAVGTTFVKKSAWRNMDFGNASTFTRTAEISGKGYEPPPGGASHYDFDLFVTTQEHRDVPARPGLAAQGPQSQITWTARGLRHTGRFITIGRTRFEVVQQVGAFGFIVQHPGDVKAWEFELSGGGIQKIANNRYRVRVPQNGAVTVTTTIEAVEPDDPVPPVGGFRRWGLSLHAGTSFPHGNFNTLFSPGGNFGVDLEYRINPNFSLEGIYTFHHFRGETFGPITISDINIHQFSVNGKVYGSSAPIRPFFNFGGGAYKFDPGSTRGGLNVGGGVQFDVTPNIAIDTMYNFHNVFTSGSSTRFSTLQGGVRFRF